jgi:hypothetical protein
MKSPRNSFVRLSVFGALVIAFALGCGSLPILASSAWGQEPMPNQNQKQTTTFTGTIAHNGDQFVLRDSSGVTYKLDDTERAKQFEGKTVKVTGQLDQDAKIIHVESIEAVTA